MRRVFVAMVAALVLPAAARAEPIPISVASSANGFALQGATVGSVIDLGTIMMPNVASIGNILMAGFRTNTNELVTFMVEGLGRYDTLRFELFNPSGSDNWGDPAEQPADVPAGYTSSNNRDALSFAQEAGLERSAVFAGGQGTLLADDCNWYRFEAIEGLYYTFSLCDAVLAGGSSDFYSYLHVFDEACKAGRLRRPRVPLVAMQRGGPEVVRVTKHERAGLPQSAGALDAGPQVGRQPERDVGALSRRDDLAVALAGVRPHRLGLPVVEARLAVHRQVDRPADAADGGPVPRSGR